MGSTFSPILLINYRERERERERVVVVHYARGGEEYRFLFDIRYSRGVQLRKEKKSTTIIISYKSSGGKEWLLSPL